MMLIFYAFNDDIVDIEKPGGICSPNSVVDKFSGLFLHPAIFSIKHSLFAQITNDTLSGFSY